MATTKITDLTAYTDPVNTDVLPIVDVTSDVTKKVSIANVMKNASLGSAAAPGIAFDGDPNTGIYSPGANQVAITTDGTQRMLIDSAGAVTIAGDLTVNGTTTNINTQNLIVEDKNVVLGDVAVPTDVTADGGGITLKGTTDKTINWVDSTDAWTSSERFSYPTGSAAAPTLTFTGDPNTGIYSPGADQVAISTNGTGRLFVDASGRLLLGANSTSGASTFYDDIVVTNTTAGTGAGITLVANATNGFNAVDFGDTDAIGRGRITYSHADDSLRIDTAGNERLRITSTGALNFIGAGTAGSTQAVSFNGSAPVNSMVLTSGGLLGIGTSTVGDTLHVKGSSTYGGVIADNSAATGGGAFRAYRNGVQKAIFCADSWVTGTSSDDAAIYADAGGGIKFYTNNSSTAKAVLTSGGSLGIGSTSDPGSIGSRLWIDTTGDTYFTANTTGSGNLTGIHLRNSNGNGEARILNNTGGALTFYRSPGNEAARIDSSGRWLLGTSSTSLAATALLQGNSSVGTTGAGILKLARGEATPANGIIIGEVRFTDSGHTSAATFECQRDGGTWTSGTSQPTRLTFSTTADGASSPTERMRINEKGAFKASTSGSYTGATAAYHEFYQTGNTTGLYIRATSGSYTSSVLEINGDRATTNATYNLINAYNGAISGQLVVRDSGNVINSNNSYGAISDIKLKENIVDATSQWSDIKALQVRKYNFKKGQTHTQIGLVAQEVELVSPGLVSESPDRDAEGNDLGTVTKSVNYSVLYMKAVKALQEAMERIEQLEAKVAALESA
jgi:hypothetical protein